MTAKEYIYRMLDTYSLDKGSPHVMINASDVQVEACMIAFAQEKVKEAIQEVIENTGLEEVTSEELDDDEYRPNITGWDGTIWAVDTNSMKIAYPLENVK